MTSISQTQSKYIKPGREVQAFHFLSCLFMFTLFVMPQYTGIPTPLFDFTLLRIMLLVMLILILADTKRAQEFYEIIFSRYSAVLIPYLIVISYTMVLRVDFNALLNPLFEILGLFLTIYVVKYSLGIKETIKLVVKFSYLLTFLGLIEYVIGVTPFYFIKTIEGIYTGTFIRSGHYRIMSSCTHSLGYGLLLMTVVPFACIDYEENKVRLSKNLPLLVLTATNVLLTGSRSSLTVFVLELVIMFLVQSKEDKKIGIIFISIMIIVLSVFLMVFSRSGIAQYIMLQITSIMDAAFDTNFAEKYGASTQALNDSSNYREQLKYIYSVSWLNPLVGIGRKNSFACEINGSFIESIDDFYIAEYVRYAYPGLFSFVFYLGYMMVLMIKTAIKESSAMCKAFVIGCASYMLNLHWVDSLQTFKYLYIIFAMFIVYHWDKQSIPKMDMQRSKYIRSRT